MSFDWVCYLGMMLAFIAGVGAGAEWTARSIEQEARRKAAADRDESDELESSDAV